MEIASSLAVGLFSGIYAQVDPMHVGEAGRANRVAKQYGEMLIVKGQNSTSEKLERLISAYASHEFVIDRHEANELFNTVRAPNPLESELSKLLGRKALWPNCYSSGPEIAFLSEQRRAPKAKEKPAKFPAGGIRGGAANFPEIPQRRRR